MLFAPQTTHTIGDTRLGAILTRMGLVSKTDVANGLAIVSSTRLPLGNVLLLRQKLSRSTLRLAIEAQWMMKDGFLDETMAYEALQLAKRNEWTLNDALLALGNEAFPEKSVRLGELLVRTNILKEDQLAEELELANLTGLPLGRVIVARRRLAEGTVWHAIRMQQAIRDETLDVERAAERLSRINERLLCTEIKLAELLVAADRLRKKDVEVAVEMAQANEMKFTEVLLDLDWVDKELLARANLVLGLLRANRLNYGESIYFLKDPRPSPYLDQLRDQPPHRTLTFYEFLRLSDYLDRDKLQDLVTQLVRDQKLLYGSLRTKSSGDKKQDVKAVLRDYISLSHVLNTIYPQDVHQLYCAKSAYLCVQRESMSPEEALVQYFEVTHPRHAVT